MADEAQERFRMLYETHSDAVYRYALRRVDADLAADVVTDAFLVAWRRLAEVPARPLPWLYGVARKAAANQRRSSDRYAALADRVAAAMAVSGGASSGEVDTAVINSTSLATALSQLSEDERDVLALVVWEGLTARDTAAALGCSVPAVTMRLHRARRRLRAALDEQDEEG